MLGLGLLNRLRYLGPVKITVVALRGEFLPVQNCELGVLYPDPCGQGKMLALYRSRCVPIFFIAMGTFILSRMRLAGMSFFSARVKMPRDSRPPIWSRIAFYLASISNLRSLEFNTSTLWIAWSNIQDNLRCTCGFLTVVLYSKIWLIFNAFSSIASVIVTIYLSMLSPEVVRPMPLIFLCTREHHFVVVWGTK